MIAEEIWNGARCEKHSAPKLWGQTNAFAQSWSTVGIHKTGKLPRWERATGTEMNEGIIVATFPEVNRYLNAQNYSLGVKADLKTLSKFVREELFYVFVHDFKNDEDDCLALACDEFVEYCLEPDNKKTITNPHIQTATPTEFKEYLRFLWKEGLKTNLKGRGNIRKDLSHEKSAVYASIADAFKSKYSVLGAPTNLARHP